MNCLYKEPSVAPDAVGKAVMEEDIDRGEACCDGTPTSQQILMYFSQSRFNPLHAHRFVFAVDVYHPDMNESHLFVNCLKDLDIVIGRKTKITMVSLEAMQAIYGMQMVSNLVFDEAGKPTGEKIDVTFLNVQMGPVGVQKNSTAEEALIALYNSTYVHLPHKQTYLVGQDGRIAESRRRDRLLIGDKIYLVFRVVPLSDPPRYFSFATSQGRFAWIPTWEGDEFREKVDWRPQSNVVYHNGPTLARFAWSARPGTVYPDIITCDRTLEDGQHRLIGFVETVERESYVRAKLTLSTIFDAKVVDIA